jgi:hypothetical protein
MAFAELWLPIVGAGICIAWAIGAWYGGNKYLSIWLVFAGVVSLFFLATLQWQHHIEKTETANKTSGTRTYLTMSLGAVVLNSPSPGQVTAWIRIKNSGTTPAFHVRAWQKFLRGPTGQDPFERTQEFENEIILGAGEDFNLSSTLTIDAEQFVGIRNKTLSFYVWGRVEYVDEIKQPRFFSFKSIMNGPPETIVVDGVRAEGWGLRATKDGFAAN